MRLQSVADGCRLMKKREDENTSDFHLKICFTRDSDIFGVDFLYEIKLKNSC